MKRIYLLLLTVILSLGSLTAQTMIDRIVAVVGNEIITESDLNERVKFVAVQNNLDPKREDLRRQILDGMISEKLILAQALIDSVEITDEEVTRALDQQIANFVRQVGSEQRVEEIYGKSMSRIKREYKDEMKNQLLAQKERQQHEASISVTRREVEDFYEAYRDSLPQVPEEFELSHIYMVPKADPKVEEKTRAVLQKILDSIRAGGDFADFARRYSADPGSASSGGDLGWEKRGAFVRDFEETAFGLRNGEISGIVKTVFGLHIIQMIERRGESIHVRHILMKIEKGAASDSATVDTLRAIRRRIMGGESFADMAKLYSEDEDTKKLGGNLGSLTADQLQPDFAEQVKNLKEGDISMPLRAVVGASYGYHIIWMRKRIPPHNVDLKNDFKRVEQFALYMKKNKINAEWLNELKKTIYMDIRY
jgi:peptidyl-prolyl cis-trans isomerase SurA